jgi:putative SOS response-associated peptidase YedK
MCGRYTLRTKLNLLLDQFAAELAGEIDYRPRYNIAPTQSVLAVRQPEQGAKRELVELRWGLIPVWAKDTKIAYSTINARGDTVAEKPSFRAAFKKRRCLIMADGYFEWLKEGKAKLPQLYEIDDGKPFAFAGLWEYWPGPKDGKPQPIEPCTIITTEANKLAAKVHDRMPVILHPDDYDSWLDPTNDDRATLEKLIKPFPMKPMSVRPVSTYVNNVKNQGEECIAPPAETEP